MPPVPGIKIMLSGIFGVVGLIIIYYGAMLIIAVTAGQLDPIEAANAIIYVGLGFVLLLMAFIICLKGPRF